MPEKDTYRRFEIHSRYEQVQVTRSGRDPTSEKTFQSCHGHSNGDKN